MKKVLYTKYNSTRKPEFQIKTSIISEDGNKYVLKQPLKPQGAEHIENIAGNYEKLKAVSGRIKPVPFKRMGDGLAFEFVQGKGLLDDVDFRKDELSDIIAAVRTALEIIIEMSKQVSNLDAIFSNFIIQDNSIICIDYEWVFSQEIPVDFISFRALYYLYQENGTVLKQRITLEDFLSSFGFSGEDISSYLEMDNRFQDYVHGENRKYIYTRRYEQPVKKLSPSETELALKDNHINNLTKQLENMKQTMELKDNHIDNLTKLLDADNAEICRLNQLTKLVSPFYKVAKFGKRGYNKIFYKFASEEAKERHRLGKYRYKYRDLWQSEDDNIYEKWITKVEKGYETGESFQYNPKISILVPVYNVLDRHLIPCIESVKNQTYTNWELCLADDASTWDNVRETLRKYENDERIKVVYRQENGHISRCTNSALQIATGEFVAFLDCDDILKENALYEVVKKLNEDRSLDFIYSDEDKIDDDGGNRHMPHFKPDWSPDTLLSHMYTCHFGVYRRSIAEEIGGLRVGYEGSQDYDFALRFTEKTDRVGHIAKILYHWRERAESTAGNEEAKPYIIEATRKCKEDALRRRNIAADVEQLGSTYWFRIIYKIIGEPKVSILIPSKDNYDILERCIDSIYRVTDYRNFEIVLVDNGSSQENRKKYGLLADKYGFKYIYQAMEFNFSRMCNIAAENATGDYYLFLNDDTEVVEGQWLSRMLGQAMQPHIGAVGAKLVYSETGNIQHVGVINIGSGPAHAFAGFSDDYTYYFARNKIEYDYIAVTAACLLVDSRKYREVGGFDEELAVAYNDVDFCFKLVEHGYYNVVRTDAVLIHHESVSRGDDLKDMAKIRRLQQEQQSLYDKHPAFDIYDPFYNVNLCQDNVDFSNNYTHMDLDYSHVVNGRKNYSLSDKVRGNVDIIRVTKTLYLEGWGFISGYRKNNDTDILIELRNDDKVYLVDTKKVYRADVARNNTVERDIEFTGFRCELPKTIFEPGTYSVRIICRKYALQTEVTVTL